MYYIYLYIFILYIYIYTLNILGIFLLKRFEIIFYFKVILYLAR